MGLVEWYRGTGADLPFGRPERAHRGVSMEGYFWRITDPGTGRVVIALCGANNGPTGAWATLGLAAWPTGFLRIDAQVGAWTSTDGLGVRGGARGPAFVLPVPLPSEHRNVAGDLEHLVGDLTVTVSRFGHHVWSGSTAPAALEHGGFDRAQHELIRRGLDPTLTAATPAGCSTIS